MKRILSLLSSLLFLIVLCMACKEPVKVEPGMINGFVTDKTTGDPIENVDVILKPVGKSFATSADGYFEFAELEVGDYSLSASKAGYKDFIDNQTISVKSLQTMNRDIVMERLLSSLAIVDNDGNLINEINFGNINNDNSRTFNLLNNGEIALDYKIENAASWIVNISNSEGLLETDSLRQIDVEIDRTKLSIGENVATINIISGDINIILSVKAYKHVSVMTLDPADVTTNSAVLKGSINLEGKSITEKGFVLYADINNPTEYVVSGNDFGEFAYQVSELEDATTYYYKAYMICNEETVYGEEKSFTTIEEIIITLPEVVTVSVEEVTEYTAFFTGEVLSDGGAEVVERGFIWKNPIEEGPIEDFRVQVGSGIGVYTYSVTGLYPNTDYWVLAYAINSEGEALGEYINFTTLEEEEEEEETLINGYEYVDLGLPSGLKWAVHNVGANSAEEYGEYFAWGEIETKTSYSQDNCVTYGMEMEDFSGNPQYDVARAQWGATWRMPTREEQKELIDNCTWEWTTQNDVNGYLVTGSNGNSIFLPAAGYYENSSLIEVGEYGYYWSSTPQSNSNLGAYYLYMSDTSKLSYYYARVAGQSVRAVSE